VNDEGAEYDWLEERLRAALGPGPPGYGGVDPEAMLADLQRRRRFTTARGAADAGEPGAPPDEPTEECSPG
jgi:hypothetical protein